MIPKGHQLHARWTERWLCLCRACSSWWQPWSRCTSFWHPSMETYENQRNIISRWVCQMFYSAALCCSASHHAHHPVCNGFKTEVKISDAEVGWVAEDCPCMELKHFIGILASALLEKEIWGRRKTKAVKSDLQYSWKLWCQGRLG